MASPTVAPTSWVDTIFKNIFAKLDWAAIADGVASKSVGGYITTAEHVGGEILAGVAATGNPIAVEVEAVLPAAEAILGAVINMVPAFQKAIPAPAGATPPKA